MVRRARVGILVFFLASFLWGCAPHRPDPFIYGPQTHKREKGKTPPCFTGPLQDCLLDPLRRDLDSRWRYPFQPDLQHRVCRGDTDARRRLLEGARELTSDATPGTQRRIYLEFLSGCSSISFCKWALTTAADAEEPIVTRDLFLEGARRGCAGVVEAQALERVGAELGRSLGEEPPRVRNTSTERCAEIDRPDDPWSDLVATRSAGCLDLGEWLDRHRHDKPGVTEALLRCVDGSEIRYREAACLRELAVLDRQRALDYVRAHSRRGWGRSSSVTPYVRTLLRFPETGQLESELARRALIADGPASAPIAGAASILADEVLESRGRLLRFNPSCAVRYCEHAPLLYRLADLAGPTLDDLIIEERWPALERVDLGSGTRSVSTTVGGIPVQLKVAAGEEPKSLDREHLAQLRGDIERARAAPHEILIHAGKRVYKLRLRNLGEWYDLETLLGGLNTILAERKSDTRYVTLAPNCIPCARVLAGPRDGLIDAAFDGLIEVVDPFKELWPLKQFDPLLVDTERTRRAAGER